MEWITEGVALIFLGALAAVVTMIDSQHAVAQAVYSLSALALFTLAIVSLLTGFKVRFLPFRLCPLVFGTSAVLIMAGALL